MMFISYALKSIFDFHNKRYPKWLMMGSIIENTIVILVMVLFSTILVDKLKDQDKKYFNKEQNIVERKIRSVNKSAIFYDDKDKPLEILGR